MDKTNSCILLFVVILKSLCNSQDYNNDEYNYNEYYDYNDDYSQDLNDYYDQNLPPNPPLAPPRPPPIPPIPPPPPPMGKITFCFYFEYNDEIYLGRLFTLKSLHSLSVSYFLLIFVQKRLTTFTNFHSWK